MRLVSAGSPEASWAVESASPRIQKLIGKNLDIEKAARSLTKPFLQVHGDMDLSVSISEGQRLAEWTGTDLCIIKGAEHTFGTKQPWEASELPEDMLRAMSAIIFFFEGDQ